MASEAYIYRTAKQTIEKAVKQHPKQYAIAKTCSLYQKGDIEAAIVWAKIGNAIDDLLTDNPDGIFH